MLTEHATILRSLLLTALCGTVSISSFDTWAESNIPAQLHLGFYAKDSAAIPTAVKAQITNIFRFDSPYFTDVRQKYYDELLGNIKLSEEAKADLRLCQKANLEKCVIHFGNIQGTTFLNEDGSSLWTNCHLISSWISYKKQSLKIAMAPEASWQKEILTSSIPLTLTNSDGLIIYPTESSGTAVLEAAVLTGRFSPQDLDCSTMDDVVKIRLSVKLGDSGIKHAKNRPLLNSNQKLFIGGNPRLTDTRKPLGHDDSDGINFFWTSGPHLAKGEDFSRYMNGKSDLGLLLNGPNAQAILSDSAEGMSGGPVLNEEGELVGIFKGLMPLDSAKKDIPLYSIFLDLNELRYVEIFSESYKNQ